MGELKVVESLVSGGQANAGPPLGPALGPLGVNVLAIVTKINEVTKDFSGMKVPVKISVDTETKEFEVSVGTPPTAALLVSEVGVTKGSGVPNTEKIGNITLEQAVKIAKMKKEDVLGSTLKACVKEVIGTGVSMGITVEGKDPRDVQKEIDEGKHDALLAE
jgi:large subunit ribosomal protein L11